MPSMNGRLVRRVLPLTTRDFSNIQGSMNMFITAATHIPTVDFTAAELVFRLHSGTTLGPGTTVTFGAHGDGYCDFDPASVFDTTLASVMVSSWTGPQVQVLSVPAGFGKYLRATITGVQPVTPQTLVVVVSVDLVLKGGDPNDTSVSPNEFSGYGMT